MCEKNYLVEQYCPNVEGDDSFKVMKHDSEHAHLLSLDLNIDWPSGTVTAIGSRSAIAYLGVNSPNLELRSEGSSNAIVALCETI